MVSRRVRLDQQRVPQSRDELRGQHRDGGAVHGEGQVPVLIGEQFPRFVARPPPYPALGSSLGRAAQKVAVVRQQNHHEGPSGFGDPLGEGHLRQLGQCSIGHQFKDQTAPSPAEEDKTTPGKTGRAPAPYTRLHISLSQEPGKRIP